MFVPGYSQLAPIDQCRLCSRAFNMAANSAPAATDGQGCQLSRMDGFHGDPKRAALGGPTHVQFSTPLRAKLVKLIGGKLVVLPYPKIMNIMCAELMDSARDS